MPRVQTQQKPIIATEPQALRCRGFAMAQPLGTTPTNHQPLVCCSLAHSPSLLAGSHWRSAVTNAPPVFPILLIQPALPQTTAFVCAPVLPHCTLIASARAVSSHLDFAPSSSFERPAASDGAFVAISKPIPTSQTGKGIVVLAGPLLDPSLHIAI